MAYILIIIVLVCSSVKGYCGKKVSSSTNNKVDSFLFNALRMLFCVLIGLLLVFMEGTQAALQLDAGMFWICVLSGISNAAFLVGWLFAVQKNTMVTVDVGLTLGSILPAVLCALLFNEKILLPKLIGFCLILAATVVLAGRSEKNVGSSVGGILLILFAAMGDGLSGFAQQLYKQFYTEVGSFATGVYYPMTVFHFYTFGIAGLVLLAALIVSLLTANQKIECDKTVVKSVLSVSPRVVLYIFVMAVCLFAANYLQTLVTSVYGMSAQVLYPILKGGCLITVNFTAMIFFGERITLRSVCGSLIALVGIICMSVL